MTRASRGRRDMPESCVESVECAGAASMVGLILLMLEVGGGRGVVEVRAAAAVAISAVVPLGRVDIVGGGGLPVGVVVVGTRRWGGWGFR